MVEAASCRLNIRQDGASTIFFDRLLVDYMVEAASCRLNIRQDGASTIFFDRLLVDYMVEAASCRFHHKVRLLEKAKVKVAKVKVAKVGWASPTEMVGEAHPTCMTLLN